MHCCPVKELSLKVARIVLAHEMGEEGTHCGMQWGGEGNEVEVPSSIPSVFAALRRTGPFLLPLRRRRRKSKKDLLPSAERLNYCHFRVPRICAKISSSVGVLVRVLRRVVLRRRVPK